MPKASRLCAIRGVETRNSRGARLGVFPSIGDW